MTIGPMKHTVVIGISLALFCVGLLAACGDDRTEEKPKTKGVFTPYVDAHNEAQQAAAALNEAMAREEQRVQERD